MFAYPANSRTSITTSLSFRTGNKAKVQLEVEPFAGKCQGWNVCYLCGRIILPASEGIKGFG